MQLPQIKVNISEFSTSKAIEQKDVEFWKFLNEMIGFYFCNNKSFFPKLFNGERIIALNRTC